MAKNRIGKCRCAEADATVMYLTARQRLRSLKQDCKPDRWRV